MENLKMILTKQFSLCYDQNGWFVAVRNALEGLTAELASWKPDGADNSIWETLAHLTYYNYAYLERFKGVEYQYDVADNDATFEQAENASDDDWYAAVEKFDKVLTYSTLC